jgi:hypothetical protein
VDRDVEIGLGDAGEVTLQDEGLAGLLDLECRDERAGLAGAGEERVPGQQVTGELERIACDMRAGTLEPLPLEVMSSDMRILPGREAAVRAPSW